ncbi:UNVERIFIED_CONTAM: hypothetical protein Scaly_2765900 [Sesamum calycinum]|uniref:Reverse transcriptase domain-containing protein n=1 Tax=Sesamum calycinum TaxID=2727403 RepID=A0AAW2IYB8_9LAMI
MANLKSLKDRWDLKFKLRKNSPELPKPTQEILKPVAGRIETPFRSRVSLLPRRNLSGHRSYCADEPVPVDGDVGSLRVMGTQEVAGNRFVDSEHAGCSFTSDSTPLTQEGGRSVGISETMMWVGLSNPIRSTAVDNIAGAFLNSSRKTLQFVPPTRQNGEIIVRPSKEVVEAGSKKWHATAVVTGCHGGDYRRGSMAFQGQPIVLQFWEQGLSTVASGVGTPLYTDGITKECSRLDYARVCVMLNYKSTLPKHLIVISPILRDGKEDPKRVDIEYEWLPQRCKSCCSLGHVASTCPDSKKTSQGPPITIFVKKQSSTSGPEQPERGTEEELNMAGSKSSGSAGYVPVCSAQPAGKSLELTSSKGKDIAIYNSYGVLASASLDNDTNISCGISDEPWLVLGDFNAVLDDSEVRGRAADTSVSMAEFRTCILDTGLVQLPFTGCPYTWHNCSEGTRSLWKRLDRMLVNEAHKWRGRTSIFRFDNYLAQLPGFLVRLTISETHGNLTENVKLAKAYLDKAQELFAVYRDDILLHLVKCCRMVYSEAIKLEMSMLKQRAKLRWMKHGDQNSRVFFRKINSKRAKHMIFQITNATELKHTLTLEEASFLIRPVTREEIKEAIFDIDEESAPGPDGYTSAFFKTAWPVVGQAISEAICEFFRTGQLLKQVNTTLLALIPKVNLPSYVSDYRPISCCNVLYKAITKVIVKRMQPIHLLIDFSQTAFVPGRSIADNILLAQELLAGYNQRRLPPRCTIKVDIQKAYDSVEWDFLLEVLRLFNFPPRFVGWIEQCVTTASFSVSLNGAIYGFFKGSRGLTG